MGAPFEDEAVPAGFFFQIISRTWHGSKRRVLLPFTARVTCDYRNTFCYIDPVSCVGMVACTVMLDRSA